MKTNRKIVNQITDSTPVSFVVGTTATSLCFKDITPVAPHGLGGMTRDLFGNGRLYVSLGEHGGLLQVSYWGNQHLGAPAFFRADPCSAWIKLFRMYATIDGKRYYLTLNDTELCPFGYRSRCTLCGVEFEHELILLPDVLVQRVRVKRNPRRLPVQIEMMHHEACASVEHQNRQWSEFAFDRRQNAMIASCRDRNPVVYRGNDSLAQKDLGLVVKDAPDTTTWFGLGCDLPLAATRGYHERSKHYLVSRPAGGQVAAYFLAIAPDQKSLGRRIKQLAVNVHKECDRCIAGYQNRLKARPKIQTGSPVLNSFFMQMPEVIQCAKVPDRAGAVRATLAGYFVWGWDGMTPMISSAVANEPEYTAAILRFWQEMRSPVIGIPIQVTTAFKPRLKTAISAQCQYILGVYHYIATTGDMAIAKEILPTCEFILNRCRKKEVCDTGLVEGSAMWPDFPEAMEEDGGDISSLNNSLVYQGLRAMEYIYAALGKTRCADECRDWAKRLRASFVKYLYDKEKGYFISSCSSKTLKPRKHYCSQAIFWNTPFARELVSHDPIRIAAFMNEHLRSDKCLLSLPRWDAAWMADGNQLGASYPVADYFYLNVHKLISDAKAIDAWLGDVEWFWRRHTVPESFTPEAYNESDIGPDNAGCKQMQACTTWYASLYNALAGMDFDHEGLTLTPWGDRPLEIKNLKLRKFSVDISIRGIGSHMASLTLNGKKMPAGLHKIAWSIFKSGRNKLQIVRTNTASTHPVIVRADGLRVESVKTKADSLKAHVAGDMSGEVVIRVPGRKYVIVNGVKSRCAYDSWTKTVTIALDNGLPAEIIIP